MGSEDKRTQRQTGIYETREQLVQGVNRFLEGGKSITEISRLTGVSRGIVQRITKGDPVATHTEPYVCQAHRLNKLWKCTSN